MYQSWQQNKGLFEIQFKKTNLLSILNCE
jgi:hypothetical protein